MELKLCLAILPLVYIGSLYADNLKDCPNEDVANVLVMDFGFSIEGEDDVDIDRNITVPYAGRLEYPITCMMAIDVSFDNSGGSVEVIEGGVNFTYATIYFHSQLGKGLKYLVKAYTDDHGNITASAKSNY